MGGAPGSPGQPEQDGVEAVSVAHGEGRFSTAAQWLASVNDEKRDDCRGCQPFWELAAPRWCRELPTPVSGITTSQSPRATTMA